MPVKDIKKWHDLQKTMPSSVYGMAIGHYNGTIQLIGGRIAYISNKSVETVITDQLTSYNLKKRSFETNSDLQFASNVRVFGIQQFSTQSGDTIYMMSTVKANDGLFEPSKLDMSTYNMKTKVFTPNSQILNLKGTYNQDYADYSGACVTSSNEYLFVIGDNVNGISSVFKIQTGKWIQRPKLKTRRTLSACAVYGDYVYAIGGFKEKSIERMPISKSESQLRWEKTDKPLEQGVYAARAVAIEDGIVVVGGGIFPPKNGHYYIDSVQVLSIDKQNVFSGVDVTSIAPIKIAVSSSAVIAVKHQIFNFGGIGDSPNNHGITNQAQVLNIKDISTLKPTKSPSPSLFPTTVSPTNINESSNGLSSANLGIIIGCSIVVCILIIVAVFFGRKYCKKNEKKKKKWSRSKIHHDYSQANEFETSDGDDELMRQIKRSMNAQQ